MFSLISSIVLTAAVNAQGAFDAGQALEGASPACQAELQSSIESLSDLTDNIFF